MKKLMLCVAVASTPAFLIAPVYAQEEVPAKSEDVVKVKKPTLTFYFYDG